MVKFKLLETTKPQKSCLTCKYREFDIYGWCCNKHNKYFDNELHLYEINEQKCKYHKRDSYYYLSNGTDKYIVKEVLACEEITELSFRQMIKEDGTIDYTLYDYLKKGHMKDWYYIEQQDYNEYFVQDHLEREYLAIK